MVNAQEWLSQNYSKGRKDGARELDLCNLNLEGDLDLWGFRYGLKIYLADNPHLGKIKNEPGGIKIIYSYKNPQGWLNRKYPNKNQVKIIDLRNLYFDQPGELIIDNYPNLKEIDINNTSELTKLATRNCPKLEGINIKQWKDLGFSSEETSQWINTGVKVNDYKFVKWLRDIKKETPQWITNYKEDYQILSERFKKYGLCEECNQPNTGEKWCKDCNSKHSATRFAQLSLSNDQKIDKFIQELQLKATEKDKFLEWIPYEQFTDIEYLAQGGFGTVYKAKWIAGNIGHWDIENNQWYRERKEVVLKSLNNSQGNTDFLDETEKHKIIDDWFNNIVPCYGLSQDSQGNYVMVMQYIEGGNLRHYLNNKKLTFQNRLKRLTNIIQGLKDVHSKKLVHRDFHSGNILNSDIHSFVTDLGLCKPANEVNKESEVYGVLPYVAPEVLRKKGYTPASDIYSLGMVTYEIFANASPYLDREYDTFLALDICRGLRPDLDSIKIPLILKDLINQCWNDDPVKRPTAIEIERTLRNWQKQDYRFMDQIQAIEKEYNQASQNSTYKFHPTASMNSKLINTKEITRLLSQPQEASGSIYLKGSSDLESCAINMENLNLEENQQPLQIQPAYGTPGSSK